eukprot:CAMPEP_0113906050 /NCGR_PEP_ID=MMETSP0780_2-20120614/24470_1 /TAXON_ID=652834 /ORGANISM="Palpitomonas bilix" /LENGTH=202 /DNA_ID=CAMNT_0000900483 /DNA_START=180 /DNA_END=785 /DNA_ORIENTATION=- /assembly_acc=CAM_ASM_000599
MAEKRKREPSRFVVPGDIIAEDESGDGGKVGNGLYVRGEIVMASKAGLLKKAKGSQVYVENHQRRYVPLVGDVVLGVVVERHGESYKVDIGAPSKAVLPHLAFEGATKRNRPNLEVGSLVYARIACADRDLDPELTCISPDSKKGWMTGQSLYGELNGGTVIELSSLRYARALLDGSGAAVLRSLGERLPFEIACGLNGRVW